MANTRDLLIDTMKQLLWERGYDATSPNLVLERSGTGKGSFYHHFKGKKELAIAAMESRADQLIEEFDQVTAGKQGGVAKVKAYMSLPRDATVGCRMGRIVQDPSLEDELLNAPLQRYFSEIHKRMRRFLQDAQEAGELSRLLTAEQLATLAICALQGSFVLGRAIGEKETANQATDAFMQLLEAQTLN